MLCSECTKDMYHPTDDQWQRYMMVMMRCEKCGSHPSIVLWDLVDDEED